MNKETNSNTNRLQTTSYLANNSLSIHGSIKGDQIVISPGQYASVDFVGTPEWFINISCADVFPVLTLKVSEDSISLEFSSDWEVITNEEKGIYCFYYQTDEGIYMITYKLFKTDTPPHGGIAMVGTVSTLTSRPL